LIEAHAATVSFFVPEFALAEAEEHLAVLVKRRNGDPEKALALLRALASLVEVIRFEIYGLFESEARARLGKRDPDDWPILATALAVNCPIWTEDTDFFGCGVATWTGPLIGCECFCKNKQRALFCFAPVSANISLMKREAVIVDAVRTPLGKRDGMLKTWHPVDLLAFALNGLVQRNKLNPELIEDVIAGCVMQVGEQAANIARNAVLAAGFPESIPGTSVDRQCGSSQQAIHFAAQGVLAGSYDVVVGCGVESMTRVPMGSSAANGPGKPFGPAMKRRYNDVHFHQGISAEMLAERWKISRTELDEFSLESHRRAAHASEQCWFSREVLPISVETEQGTVQAKRDEGIRVGSTIEKMASLKASFKPDGVVTAGNSSQITDGAAAVLIMERGTAERLGYRPLARFVAFALAAEDPILMLGAPIPATRRALERAGLTLNDIDRIEINEAFASVVLAWQRETKADLSRVNVNGGAIALGHPLGASGARLMTTLVHELQRTQGRYGLQTMCEGGGMANATIIERL
jgi:acetyl-CoA acetyltransferase family protein